VRNEYPTRRNTNIGIGGFTYSNHYCKLLKYTAVGEDAKLITISGSTFTYQTNLIEPKTIKYSLRVHAQGDGINGHTHIQDFPSTILIQGCDNEGNVISNPSFKAWKQTVLNDLPTRKNTDVVLGGFTYSNAFCKLLHYSIVGTDASIVTVKDKTVTYKTDLLEPRTLRFSVRVHA